MDECPQCSKSLEECQCSTRVAMNDVLPSGLTPPKGYEYVRLLGRGAAGAVYLADQLTLNKRVAIKLLYQTLAADERASRRFEIEARALANIKHPNIVEVFDLGIADDGARFIVMEYAEGVDLKHVVTRNGFLDPQRVIQLMLPLCDALTFAHDNHIIHRDLKTSNVVLVRDWQGNESVKLVDFGIAKPSIEGGEIQRLTQTGELLGSPAYMSPEQIRGGAIDHRSDIYSLGCIMFEALSGRVPFRSESLLVTLEQHLEQQPEKLSSLKPELAKWSGLTRIVDDCLSKDPDQRPSSAKEVKERLESLMPASARSRPASIPHVVAILVAAALGAAVTLGFNAIDSRSKQSPSSKISSPVPKNPAAANYIVALAHAEAIFFTGHEHAGMQIVRQILDKAIADKAKPEIQLAIALCNMQLVDPLNTNDALRIKTELYKEIEAPIANTLKGSSDGVDTVISSYILLSLANSELKFARLQAKEPDKEEELNVRLRSMNKHLNDALVLAKRRNDTANLGIIGSIYSTWGQALALKHEFAEARNKQEKAFEYHTKSQGILDSRTIAAVEDLASATIKLHKEKLNDASFQQEDWKNLNKAKDAVRQVLTAAEQSNKKPNSIKGLRALMDRLAQIQVQ